MLFLFNSMLVAAQQIPVLDWAQSTTGAFPLMIKTDDSGNVYTCGTFYGTQDFDPGPSVFNLVSNGDGDIFISKFNSSGKLLWAKSIGGVSSDQFTSVALDSSSNIHIVGMYRSSVDFDPGAGSFVLSSGVYGSLFVLKLDHNGDFIWARSFDGDGYNIPRDITVDHSGNVYTVGDMGTKIDFDPGPGSYILESNGNFDIFISKLDKDGEFAWAIHLGDTSYSYAYRIMADTSGNIYIAGHYNGTVDFDPGPNSFIMSSTGYISMYLLKLDTAAGFSWVKQIGGTGETVCNGITADKFNNIYATGFFSGNTDFDPGTDSFIMKAPTQNAFVFKWDSAGNFIFSKRLGANYATYGTAIGLDHSGNIYTGGYFERNTNMNPDPDSSVYLYAAGEQDIYISQLDPNGKYLWSGSIGGNQEDRLYAICIDQAGSLFTGGTFTGIVDFDPGAGVYNLIGGAGTEGFLQKLVLKETSTLLRNDTYDDSPVSILPNPTQNSFSLTAGRIADLLDIEVYNSKGILILHKKTAGGRNLIDLSEQVPGLYFVKIFSGNKLLGIRKVMKQ